MHDLDAFTRALYDAVPALPDALQAAGHPEPYGEFPAVWLGHVGDTLARLLESLTPTEARGALDVIEQYLWRPGADELSAALTGELLEALLRAVSEGFLSRRTLRALLGPESRAYIDAWDQFTLGHSSLEPPRKTAQRRLGIGPLVRAAARVYRRDA